MASRSINLWAYLLDQSGPSRGNVLPVCRDARLDGATGITYPQGTAAGQAGWHAALPYSNLHHLAARLRAGVPMPKEFCGNWFRDCDPIGQGELNRLAIMAHGDRGGYIYVNGEKDPLNADTVAAYREDLRAIGQYTAPNATIILMGCLAGQGPEGTRLLKALSQIWPGRSVVGFATAGYRHPGAMKRRGDNCLEPGMRETDATDYLFANPLNLDRMWSDLSKLPWSSEYSKFAKVVLNGLVTKCPAGEICN